MNWLGKLFGKKKKSYNTDCSFKLCIIDENADLVKDVLGISDKRAEEIARFTHKAYESHEKKTTSIQEMLDNCKHINEVIFAHECFNRIHDLKGKQMQLEGLMNKLFGRG